MPKLFETGATGLFVTSQCLLNLIFQSGKKKNYIYSVHSIYPPDVHIKYIMPAQKPLPPFWGSLKLVNCTPHRPTRKEAKLMVLTRLNTGQLLLNFTKVKNNKLLRLLQ
jgi:hypothetical protein